MVLSVDSVTFTWVPRDTDSFDRMKISLPPLWKLFRTEILSPLSLPDMTFPRFLLCLDPTEAKSWIFCLFMFFSSYQPEAEPSSTETESKTFQQVCSQTKMHYNAECNPYFLSHTAYGTAFPVKISSNNAIVAVKFIVPFL